MEILGKLLKKNKWYKTKKREAKGREESQTRTVQGRLDKKERKEREVERAERERKKKEVKKDNEEAETVMFVPCTPRGGC